MLNPQWVIKRPQLEKRSAWISIYLLINSECAFINFLVQGSSLVWGSLLWNSNVLSSAPTFQPGTVLCGKLYSVNMDTRRHAALYRDGWICEQTDSEELGAQSSRGKRPSVLFLWSHTLNKTCACRQHLPPACGRLAVAGLLGRFLPFYQNLHNQGCWLQH